MIEKINQESQERAPIELTVQYIGYPKQAVVWVSAEAGKNPPSRDWTSSDAKEAVRNALKDLGMESAHVVQTPDADDQHPDSTPDHDWGIVTLSKLNEEATSSKNNAKIDRGY